MGLTFHPPVPAVSRGVAPRRSRTATALGLITMFEGVTAIGGGIAFLVDTTGGVYTDDPAFLAILEGTPIDTFLLPGLFLLTVVGLVPLASGLGILRPRSLPRLRWLEDRTGYHWPWAVTIGVGLALLAWMAVELVVMEEADLLHVVYGVWGVLLVVGPLLPSVRRWLAL
jgi:hypothetical protein